MSMSSSCVHTNEDVFPHPWCVEVFRDRSLDLGRRTPLAIEILFLPSCASDPCLGQVTLTRGPDVGPSAPSAGSDPRPTNGENTSSHLAEGQGSASGSTSLTRNCAWRLQLWRATTCISARLAMKTCGSNMTITSLTLGSIRRESWRLWRRRKRVRGQDRFCDPACHDNISVRGLRLHLDIHLNPAGPPRSRSPSHSPPSASLICILRISISQS